jgi:hypothetical protein
MPQVAVLFAHQHIAVQVALYGSSLLALALAGALAQALLIQALGATGETLAASPTWQALVGTSSKHDALLSLGVLIYAALLLALEPAIRLLSSAFGDVLVTSLMLAPILGAVIRSKHAVR